MSASGIYLAIMISSLSLVISIIGFVYFRSYLKRRTSQERILSEMRTEVNTILKSIDETTERDISLIEEREKRLKSLLDDIDRRLKTYIKEMESRRNAEESYAALRQRKTDTAENEGLPAGRDTGTYAELGKNRYRIQRQEAPAALPAGPSPRESSDNAYPLPPFKVSAEAAPGSNESEQIRQMLLAGLSAPLIASRLGLSIAEVEFAAALIERQTKQ